MQLIIVIELLLQNLILNQNVQENGEVYQNSLTK